VRDELLNDFVRDRGLGPESSGRDVLYLATFRGTFRAKRTGETRRHESHRHAVAQSIRDGQ
jgi:hypothetical protein